MVREFLAWLPEGDLELFEATGECDSVAVAVVRSVVNVEVTSSSPPAASVVVGERD